MRGSLAVFASVVPTLSLTAQVWSPERHRLFPIVPPLAFAAGVTDVATGDIDADGDVDVVVLTWFGFTSVLAGPKVVVARNDGQGRFVADAVTLSVGGIVAPPQSIALGDIDGDGDLDLAVGGVVQFSFPIPGKLFRNDGAAGFVDVSAQWPNIGEGARRMAFVDVDADGDVDLLTCNAWAGQAVPLGWPQPINRLYRNDGAGVFQDATSTGMPNVSTYNRSLTAGDVDGDGDLDVLVATGPFAGQPGRIRAFLQNAQGVLVEVPGVVPAPSLPNTAYLDVALADHDADGDLDVAVASATGAEFYENLGAGTFVAAGGIAAASAQRLVPADFDGDGRAEYLLVENAGGHPQPVRLLRNTSGIWSDVTASHFEAATLAPNVVAAFDHDGDGDVDVWGAAVPQCALWHNDGQGRLLQVATRELSNARVLAAALADVDGDGDLDAAIANRRSGDAGEVLFCRGAAGTLPPATQVLVPLSEGQQPLVLQWLDADLDGDADLFVAMENGWNRLFHQVGGQFVDASAAHLPATGASRRLAAGDLTGDGIFDLVLASPSVGGCRLLRGDGTGGFVDAGSALSGAFATANDVALLDFDQDGDLDLVQSVPGGASGGLRLLRNDWPSPFVDVTAVAGLPQVEALAVASLDVDRDGRLDLLVGNGAPGGPGLLVFRAVGVGFVDETAARMPAAPPVVSIASVDLDGDGWVDLVCRANPQEQPLELRNGQGVFARFVANGPAFLDTYLPERPAAADLDADGDQDLVHTFGVLHDRTRQLQNARPPRLGCAAALVVHAYDGNGVDPQAVLLFLSPQLAPAPVGTPFGVLFLDPAQTSYHSTHLLPGTGGEATIDYSVPASSSVLGRVVHAQAVFVHEPDPSTWRLGNVLSLEVKL